MSSLPEAWTREDVIDAVSDAMSDVQDMDTGFNDFARAAVAFLEREGLLRLPATSAERSAA